MAKGKLYTDEFKKQIVALYNNDKSPSNILKEYGIARATLVSVKSYTCRI